MEDELLEEESPWVCVTCSACDEMCPMGVHPFEVCLAIRLTMPKVGVELVDLDSTACCPAFGTFPSADEIASLANTASEDSANLSSG